MSHGLVRKIFSIALCAVMPFAHGGTTFDDWEAGVTDDGKTFYAFTLNDSGSVFGEWCYASAGKCFWMIGMETGCETESSYPVLANTEALASPLSIKCGGKVTDTQLSRYQFEDYKSLEALLKGAHHIGFAFPMQSDQFKVVRFSLTGSTRAVGAMEAAIAKVLKPKGKDTRDTVL